MSTGMNRATGKGIADETEHIRQSIRDILTTPVGTRVMRRGYGSLLPSLIDQPGNPANRLRLMAATVMAIINWEPRVSVQSATIELAMNGTVTIDMQAVRTGGARAGSALSFSIPLR